MNVEALRRLAGGERLLELPHPAARTSAIYFLVKRGEVVYVGQTTHLRERASFHRLAKLYDQLFYIETPEDQLAAREAEFVRLLKPKLNKPFGRPRAKVTPDEVKAVVADLVRVGERPSVRRLARVFKCGHSTIHRLMKEI